MGKGEIIIMSKSTIPWNDFGKLKSANELTEYLQREYEHSGYFHYTSLSTIDLILKNKTLWVSPVARLNDNLEKEQFENDIDLYFSLCFSTGIHENLPLWYLYSGIDGQGGKLSLSTSCVSKLIKNGLYSLSKNNTNEHILELTDDSFEVSFKDILYYSAPKKSTNYIDLKYNTMTNHDSITVNDFEDFKKQYGPFIKSLIWFYEKETRLLVKLKGAAAEYVRKNTISDNESEYYVVKLSFADIPNIDRSIKVGFAPEIDNLEKGIAEYENIREFLYKSSRVSLSDYQGQISMRLRDRICKECSKNKEK